MSKYYKAEDVIRAIAEQLCWEARTEYGDKFTTEDWLEEAEDYVSDLPTIEVSEDCISREWLIKALDNLDWYDFDMFYKVVENAPSVVPTTEQSSMVGERKRGEWIERIGGISGELFYQCSKCYGEVDADEFNYCPWCGTDMRGAK